MKLIATLLKHIHVVILAFFVGLKDIVAFLTIDHLLVVFPINTNRYKVKGLTTTNIVRIYMYAIRTAERYRFQMINKVFHCSCLKNAAKIQ